MSQHENYTKSPQSVNVGGERRMFSKDELKVHLSMILRSMKLIDSLRMVLVSEMDEKRHVLDGNIQEAKEHLNYVAHLLNVEVTT